MNAIGDSVTIVEIHGEEGKGVIVQTLLGSDITNGEVMQHCVKANTWFGCYGNAPNGYSFMGCTVSPAFQFEDFELASRQTLTSFYQFSQRDLEIVEKLTVGLP
jgi:predicted cupin superfamily sugar epimerase